MKITNSYREPFGIGFIYSKISKIIDDKRDIKLLDLVFEDLYDVDNLCSYIFENGQPRFRKLISKNGNILDSLYTLLTDDGTICILKDLMKVKYDLISTSKSIKKYYNKGKSNKAKKANKSLKHKTKIYSKVIESLSDKYNKEPNLDEIYDNLKDYSNYGNSIFGFYNDLDDEEYDEDDYLDDLFEEAEFTDDLEENPFIQAMDIARYKPTGIDYYAVRERMIQDYDRKINSLDEEDDDDDDYATYEDLTQYFDKKYESLESLILTIVDKMSNESNYDLDKAVKLKQLEMRKEMARKFNADDDDDEDDGYDIESTNIRSIDDVVDLDAIEEASKNTVEEEESDVVDSILNDAGLTSLDNEDNETELLSEASNIKELYSLDRDSFINKLSELKDLTDDQKVNLIEIYDKTNMVKDASTMVKAYNSKKNSIPEEK